MPHRHFLLLILLMGLQLPWIKSTQSIYSQSIPTMKQLVVPTCPELGNLNAAEQKDFLQQLPAQALDCVNWPDRFPYAPTTTFRIATDAKSLYIYYETRGLGLRAVALEDNGPVWEDSCVEFFVQVPGQDCYRNFEVNCIGTLLASEKTPGSTSKRFTTEALQSIQRYPSLERKPLDISDGEFEWNLLLIIPLECLQLQALPESLRANFYKCGDKTSHPHYLSWNPITFEKPNFHLPEFFGELLF